MSKARKTPEKLVDFLQERAKKRVCPGITQALETFTPDQVLQIIQLYNKDSEAFHTLCGFARRFKKAADNLTLDEIREAKDVIQVKMVHES